MTMTFKVCTLCVLLLTLVRGNVQKFNIRNQATNEKQIDKLNNKVFDSESEIIDSGSDRELMSLSLVPTSAPYNCEPTASPDINECTEAYVYCPGRSTCFQDPNFNQGVLATDDAWGFNIFYDAAADLVVDDCGIWMGVVGCDLSTGKKVGTAVFSKDVFSFHLSKRRESNSFHLYAGSCVASDGGEHLSTGLCDKLQIATKATQVDTFPLVNEGGDYTEIFTFDSSFDSPNELLWPGYELFPIGGNTRNFIVGHLRVCPSGHTHAPSPEYNSVGTGPPVSTPMPVPISLPISLPSLIPSSISMPTFDLTNVPTTEHNAAGTEPPVSAPNSLPISPISLIPTSVSIPPLGSTNAPTASSTIDEPNIPASPSQIPPAVPSPRPSVVPGSPARVPSSVPTFQMNQLPTTNSPGSESPEISTDSDAPSDVPSDVPSDTSSDVQSDVPSALPTSTLVQENYSNARPVITAVMSVSLIAAIGALAWKGLYGGAAAAVV